MKKRNSNFELLRIVAMFMIIIIHVILHGCVLENLNDGLSKDFIVFLKCILYLAVDIFVLITGYFQCDKSFKLSNLFKINNAMWFYSSLIFILIFTFNIWPISKVELFRGTLPIQFDGYWFTKMYLVLYCISPVLNIIIKKINNQQYKKVIVFGFILFSLIPTLTNNLFYDNLRGFSLINFSFLYLIGAYLKKYPLEKSKFLSVWSPSKQQMFISIILFISIVFNFTLNRFGNTIPSVGIKGEFRKILMEHTFSYDNPLIVIGSILMFLLFSYINFSSKFINKIGSLTLGIYLIHDNYLLNNFLYNYFGFATETNIGYAAGSGIALLIRIFITAIIIFVGAAIIEYLRQLLFKFISNRKISKKISNSFYNYIDNF